MALPAPNLPAGGPFYQRAFFMDSPSSDRPADNSAPDERVQATDVHDASADEVKKTSVADKSEPIGDSKQQDESPDANRSKLPLLLFVLTLLSLAVIFVYRYTGKLTPENALIEAQAALQEKDWKRFESAMAVLMHDPPSQPAYLLLAGKALAAQGQPEQAMAVLLKCQGVGGQIEVDAICEAATIMMKEGEQVAAVQMLRRAVEIDDRALLPRKLLVQIYYDWGARGLEQMEAERWAELAPDDYAPHAWLGQQAYDLDDYQRAIDYYQAALERSVPPEVETHLKSRIASCLVKLLRADDAEKILLEIEDKKEGAIERILTLAEVRFLQGEDATALEMIDRLSQDLDNEVHREGIIEALNLKLRILQAQGRSQRALEAAKELLDIDPLNFAAHLQMAQIYRRLGKTDEAEASAKEGERLRDLRLRFAELHEVAADRVVDPEPRYELAQVAMALERLDLAEMWMAAAKQLDPRGLKRPAGLEIPESKPMDSGQGPSGSPLNLDFQMPNVKSPLKSK